jgi:hypothetical protein
MREIVAVLLEEAFGVDAVSLERPAAEVVDEQVMRHGQLETGPARSARSSLSKNPSPNCSSSPLTASGTARFMSKQNPDSGPAVNHCPRCSSRHRRANVCLSSRLVYGSFQKFCNTTAKEDSL